jgi:folate-binding protein YgfZ
MNDTSEFAQPAAAPAQLDALRAHAGVYAATATGWLRVTGNDRLRWLSGMLTNAVQQLAPGTGNYSFLLSAQGRIQGDCYAYHRDDGVLLQTAAAQIPQILAHLDHFIIMDDVELTDVSAAWHGICLTGPASPDLLRALSLPAEPLAPIGLRPFTRNGSDGLLIAAYSPTVPNFEIWSASAAESTSILAALLAAGAVECAAPAVEAHRILSGVPRYGIDIRDRDLPQETAQPRALNFSKGCYLGQEIVERIRSRGAVHRTFTGYLLDGSLPPVGTELSLDGKPMGEITSAATVPTPHDERLLALGYIRREAQMQKQPLTWSGGTAQPVELPFAWDKS